MCPENPSPTGLPKLHVQMPSLSPENICELFGQIPLHAQGPC